MIRRAPTPPCHSAAECVVRVLADMNSTSGTSAYSSYGSQQLIARMKQLERENIHLRQSNCLPTRAYRGGNFPPFANPEMAEAVIAQRLTARPESARLRPPSPRAVRCAAGCLFVLWRGRAWTWGRGPEG